MTHPLLSPGQLLDLATRYVEVWNEPDTTRRRARIEALWTPDGVHHIRTLVAAGHAALQERVSGAHARNVQAHGHHFRLAGPAHQVQDGVLLHWDMARADGQPIAWGAAFLRLAADGRIAADHQFVLPASAGAPA